MAISPGNKNEELSFALIGAGRLGSNITLELFNNGICPSQIISRTLSKAKHLAKRTQCLNASTEISISGSPSFILLAVNDGAIEKILAVLKSTDIPIFHCSGSTPINIFSEAFPNHGVLYPIQSFSIEREINFDDIPILIEASNDATFQLLESISNVLSNNVIIGNSETRMKCHIAAILSSNFSYHLFAVARDYLVRNGLPIDLLNPLLRETLDKAIDYPNEDLQTGPAAREDYGILQKHQEALKNAPSLLKLYNFVSESIIRFKKEKEKN